ncbi:ECF transporter S component [Acutalibacter caecimuris]|uniref:ECF transporter S component n=1 Tax=Acutalibacter caecimuris TaxID=3093657 RepID=UPI002AC98C9F|nr:ECF transporter S component [Acutalibacter sp. M00118]
MTKSKKNLYGVVFAGVFAALVFVSNYLSVPIPVAIGDVSRIHLGNIFCLFSGFMLGPIGGGLAAGIGSALYDLTNPAYIMSAPFTFLFKFLLAAVCGWIANAHGAHGEKHGQNILAAVCGSLVYMVLYLGKSFVQGLLLGSAMEAVLVSVGTKLVTSSINAAIAVVISVPLYTVIQLALKKLRLSLKMG